MPVSSRPPGARLRPPPWSRVNRCLAALAVAVAAAGVAPAAAQTVEWEDRAYVDLNIGVQLNGRPFSGDLALTSVSYPVANGLIILDIGGGVRAWRSVGIGAGFTRFAIDETAIIPGIDPVPVQHIDSALHVSVVWVRPLSERMDLALSGGPSFLTIQQDLVTGTLAEAVVARAEQQTVGLHASASFTYFVAPMIGIGASLRFLNGSAELESPDGSMTTFEATGWQLGFGVRLRMR